MAAALLIAYLAKTAMEGTSDVREAASLVDTFKGELSDKEQTLKTLASSAPDYST